MGKAVPKGIKSKAAIILKEMPESFEADFEKNKQIIQTLNFPFTKWTRNVMAGYITRTKKKEVLVAKKIEEAKNRTVAKKAKEMEEKPKEEKKEIKKEQAPVKKEEK
jgi:ribosomal protein S17E